MPIKAYVGQMRSGKTYEVVSHVILSALRDGRRVVSNIAGLNYEAMVELLLAEGVPIESIGKLVAVEHDQVVKPSFWRTDKDEAAGFESFIQPGDLVALDEIWRFWKKRGEIEPRAMNFVRMHGHMPHPVTGYTCEIALITQSVRDINENVRDVIQETFRMTKLTAIGSDNRYRVDIFQGGSVTKSNFLRQLQRSYDPKYFGLYSSHSQRKEGDAFAVEKNIDQRGNILNGALFRFVLPAGVLVMFFALWTVWNFLHPKQAPQDAPENPQVPGAVLPVSHAKPQFDESDRWHVVGWIAGDPMRIILSDGRKQRIIEPPRYKLTGLALETFLPSGEAVTPWTGAGRGGLIEQAAGQP